MSLFLTGILSLICIENFQDVASNGWVAFRSVESNKNLTALQDGSVVCEYEHLESWEKFDIKDEGDSFFSIKSHHNQYLSLAGDGKVQFLSKEVGVNEKFCIEKYATHSSIKGCHGYVSIYNGLVR